MKTILFALALCAMVISCKKAPGEGGFASIEGKVYVKDYDPTFTIIQSQYYLPGETVYIIYGTNTEIGNTVKTSYDGSFKFNYLQKGNYKVYVLGKDSVAPNKGNPKETLIEVNITERRQNLNLGDFIILK